MLKTSHFPVDTRHRFNVYKTSLTSHRRLIDVETTSCVYWYPLSRFNSCDPDKLQTFSDNFAMQARFLKTALLFETAKDPGL